MDTSNESDKREKKRLKEKKKEKKRLKKEAAIADDSVCVKDTLKEDVEYAEKIKKDKKHKTTDQAKPLPDTHIPPSSERKAKKEKKKKRKESDSTVVSAPELKKPKVDGESPPEVKPVQKKVEVPVHVCCIFLQK